MNGKSASRATATGSQRSETWDRQVADLIQVPPTEWQEQDYDPIRYIKHGLVLGAVAGCVSLLASIIGSVAWPSISGESQHPLRLIQVYLTFPLGETALTLEGGYLLALGCLLYLLLGMVYGAVLVTFLSYLFPRADLEARLLLCGAFSLLLWVTNFYLLLSWLQPWLFGGRWIVELVPWWVAACTHLLFGATIAVLFPVTAAQEGIVRDRPQEMER